MTDAITGLWARYLRQHLHHGVRRLRRARLPRPPAVTRGPGHLRPRGRQADPAWFPMPTGQSVGLIHDLPGAGEVVERVISEARAVLDRLQRSAR